MNMRLTGRLATTTFIVAGFVLILLIAGHALAYTWRW